MSPVTLFLKWLEEKCLLTVADFLEEKESSKYAACHFLLYGKRIIFRQSKITPTKTGQFVTLWKRNEAGITAAFHSDDPFDYMIIASVAGKHSGMFIFPKQILLQQNIISSSGKAGKRGIRVYAP